MGDYYGSHAQAFSLSNQLGRHAADINEMRTNGWKTQTLAFKTLDHQEQQKKDSDLKSDAESDITKVEQVYGLGKAVGKAGYGAALVAKQGGTAGEALSVAGNAFKQAGEGTKLFGEGAVAAKDIGGVEGIVAGALLKGGGETFAKVGAKGVGLLGTGIAAYQDIDNFVNTGNLFNTKDAAGNVVKQNLGQDIGNVATLLGGALDVATALTGGAFAPLAAAVNIFAAIDSGVSGMAQDAKEKSVDEKDVKPGAAPSQVAPQSFAQYGLLANRAHNPLEHIN